MSRIFYSVLFLLLIFSCGFVNEPQNADPWKNRMFRGVYGSSTEDRGEVNFQEKMQHLDVKIGKMKPAVFANNFYRLPGGETALFILYQSSKNVSYLEMESGKAASMDIQPDAPFSLVIGQSKAHLYYYYGGHRGTRFYQYAFESKETKAVAIEDFVVIRVADTDREDGALLACGVYKKDKPTLGFYLLDADGAQITEIIHEIALKNTVPDGDPGPYNCYFYTFADHIFFQFDNRSGIFQFDKKGNLVREITTPDRYDFSKEDNSASTTTLRGLYQEFFIDGDTLYVRPRYAREREKKLFFDAYDLVKGLYSHTFALQLDYPDGEYLFDKPVVCHSNGELHFLLQRKDNPTVYLQQVMPFPL